MNSIILICFCLLIWIGVCYYSEIANPLENKKPVENMALIEEPQEICQCLSPITTPNPEHSCTKGCELVLDRYLSVLKPYHLPEDSGEKCAPGWFLMNGYCHTDLIQPYGGPGTNCADGWVLMDGYCIPNSIPLYDSINKGTEMSSPEPRLFHYRGDYFEHIGSLIQRVTEQEDELIRIVEEINKAQGQLGDLQENTGENQINGDLEERLCIGDRETTKDDDHIKEVRLTESSLDGTN